jgi:DNA-binding NarL/FixJ family response regulator
VIAVASNSRTRAVELPALAVGVADVDTDRRRRVATALGAGGLSVVLEGNEAGGLAGGEGGIDVAVLVANGLGPAEFASIALLRDGLPGAHVVMVAGSLGPRSARGAIDAGADALVLEDQISECLALAVRAAHAGQLLVPRDWQAYVARPALSTRQKQILGMVVLGFTNDQIARKLFVAESTVKSHLSSAFAKLGVNSRNEATALILDPENGLGTGILAITGVERDDASDGPRSH